MYADSASSPRAQERARGLSLQRWITLYGGPCLSWMIPLFGWLVLEQVPSAQLNMDEIRAGNLFGLWSGHLLHFTFEHFLWDALMFSVFSRLLWTEERWSVYVWMLVGAPAISIFVFLVEPALFEYRGLSALDTVLYVRFCTGFCFVHSKSKGERILLGWIPLGGIVIKIGYELLTDQMLFVSDLGTGAHPLPSAHFAGLVIGLVWTGWRNRNS